MSRVAAVVLAAGTASRYRAADPVVSTKLVALLDGKPLVRHVAEAALASRARPVLVVTGHAERDVAASLDGLPVAFVPNPAYATGLASSLRAGLAVLPGDVTGALILLGDMPGVTGALIDRLIACFEAETARDAVVPVYAGSRGNPALLARSLFAAAATLQGDEGARRLLTRARVHDVDLGDAAVTLDIDDPTMLASAAALRARDPSGIDAGSIIYHKTTEGS